MKRSTSDGSLVDGKSLKKIGKMVKSPKPTFGKTYTEYLKPTGYKKTMLGNELQGTKMVWELQKANEDPQEEVYGGGGSVGLQGRPGLKAKTIKISKKK